MAEQYRKCAKCGITAGENRTLRFHRFPAPSKRGTTIRARVWATYCFPNEDWSSDISLKKLSVSHKMICSKHFHASSYTCDAKPMLHQFAIPHDAQDILVKLRREEETVRHTEDKSQVTEVEEFEFVTSEPFETEDITVSSKEPSTPNGVLREPDVEEAAPLSPRERRLVEKIILPQIMHQNLATNGDVPEIGQYMIITSEPPEITEYIAASPKDPEHEETSPYTMIVTSEPSEISEDMAPSPKPSTPPVDCNTTDAEDTIRQLQQQVSMLTAKFSEVEDVFVSILEAVGSNADHEAIVTAIARGLAIVRTVR